MKKLVVILLAAFALQVSAQTSQCSSSPQLSVERVKGGGGASANAVNLVWTFDIYQPCMIWEWKNPGETTWHAFSLSSGQRLTGGQYGNWYTSTTAILRVTYGSNAPSWSGWFGMISGAEVRGRCKCTKLSGKNTDHCSDYPLDAFSPYSNIVTIP